MKYSFFIQFWWDFFHLIPLNESFQNCYCRFLISLTVFEIQGAQKGKNAIFEATSKFYFSSDFDKIFFIGFLWMRSFRDVPADFFYLLPFSRYKGPKRPKMRFWRLLKIFIFHPILIGFFSLDCSQWELLELLQSIFSISYRFRDTRGPKGNVNLLSNISL